MTSVLLLSFFHVTFFFSLTYIAKYKHQHQLRSTKTSICMYAVMLHWQENDNVLTTETGKPGVAANIVRSGVQSHTWKNTVPSTEPIPTWNDLSPSKTFRPAKNQISCSITSGIYTSKNFQDDWSQVNNRQTFTDRHLLIPIN